MTYAEIPWQRLDPRMLLLDPLRTARGFLVPIVIGFIGLSRASNGIVSALVMLPFALAAAVVIGILPWLTTRYRITPTALEVHRGLLNKRQLTAPLDKIRSVDLEASLLHRVFGLSKVQVGTGVDDTRIELDSVSLPQAEELRQVLLRRVTAAAAPTAPPLAPGVGTSEAPGTTPPHPGVAHPEAPLPPYAAPYAPPPAPAPPQVLATIDWSWLRFAPFSLTRLAVVAGVIGVLSQLYGEIPIVDEETVTDAWSWVTHFPVVAVAVVAVVGALLAWLAISIAGYAIQWWGLQLVRDLGNIRLTSGLFTTRSTSVEEPRIRGVRLEEPPLLRLVGGAELKTLATGVGEGGVTTVLPPCPRRVAEGVGHTLLDEQHGDDHAHAVTVPVQAHGIRARRRCHTREQWLTLFLIAAAVVLAVIDPPWLPTWPLYVVPAVVAVLGVIGAELEYACLGHALTPEHLVSRHGSWQRTREVLERDGVIGWVIRQNPFQRRAGLATLVATTAAGGEKVEIRDIPVDRAIAVAARTTPDALADFLA